MNNNQYIPDQPFMELATDGFESRFAAPSGELAQYYSFLVASGEPHHIVAVPDATVDIIFKCSQGRPTAHVYGSVLKGKHIQFDQGARYFGVRFFPSQAEQLLNCPLDLFTDTRVALEDVQPSSSDLMEQICGSDSFDEQMALFEHYSMNKKKEDSRSLPLVQEILRRINTCCGVIRIQTLADELGYSSRYVNQLFKKHVGISPKLYERVIRFQHCLELLRKHCCDDLTELAYDAGYYDQAHFNNEFKEFSLKTPSQVFC